MHREYHGLTTTPNSHGSKETIWNLLIHNIPDDLTLQLYTGNAANFPEVIKRRPERILSKT